MRITAIIIASLLPFTRAMDEDELRLLLAIDEDDLRFLTPFSLETESDDFRLLRGDRKLLKCTSNDDCKGKYSVCADDTSYVNDGKCHECDFIEDCGSAGYCKCKGTGKGKCKKRKETGKKCKEKYECLSNKCIGKKCVA